MSTNIGRSNDDMAFRYKMPKLQTKIEGRGNGIKTVIVNMVDVAKALHVLPQYPTKFFGFELGAQSKFEKDTDRAIVNGQHSAGDLQKLLDKYINIFVLCPTCKLPEIKMEVSTSKINIDCAACGYNNALRTSHKLAAYIIKNPPNKDDDTEENLDEDVVPSSKSKTKKKKTKSDEKPDKKKGKKKKKESDDEKEDGEREDASNPNVSSVMENGGGKKSSVAGVEKTKDKDDDKVEWFTYSSKEAQKQRQLQEFAEMMKRASLESGSVGSDSGSPASSSAPRVEEIVEGVPGFKVPSNGTDKKPVVPAKESPSAVLKTYIQSGGENSRSTAEILAELRRLQLSRGLDDTQRVVTLLQAIFDVSISGAVTIVKQIQKNVPLLKKFVPDKNASKVLLGCFEDLIVSNPRLLPYTPHIFQNLYEGGVLSEETLLVWADSPPESSWMVNKESAAKLREKAGPFINWLKTADEED